MDLTALTAISPIDGRYRSQLQHLDGYFSEYALIKYRVWIEIEYFLFLADARLFKLTAKARAGVKAIAENFSLENAATIKETEKITNHTATELSGYGAHRRKDCARTAMVASKR